MSLEAKAGITLFLPALIGSYPLYRYLNGEYWPVFLVEIDATIDSNTYGSGKFGNDYGRYFSSSKEENSWWWEHAFKSITIENPTVKSLFNNTATGKDTKKIEKGYSNSGDTSLNQICENIYKEDTTNIDTAGGDNKYKEESVWKYCSPLGQKPKTIADASEESSYSGTTESNLIGKEKKDKLVAIKDESKFWSYQEFRFWNRDLSKFTVDDSPFKKKRDKNENSIMKLCEDLYKKTTSDISKYKDDFWEFCSLKGKEN